MSEWACAKAYCTCAGALGTCACEPAPEANNPAHYAVSSCAACGHEVMHRKACGECERYPCACPAAWRVENALRDIAAQLLLSRFGYGRPVLLLTEMCP